MSKSRFLLLPLVGGLAVLAGCSAVGGGSCLKPPPAADTGDLPPLRIPVGLDAPDTRSAMKVPPPEERAVAPPPVSGCLENPPQIVNLLAPTEADRKKSDEAEAKSKKPGSKKRGGRPPGRPGL